ASLTLGGSWFRPSDSPTASLARAGALAPCGWLVRVAHSRWLVVSPLGLPLQPHSLALGRSLRAAGSFASLTRGGSWFRPLDSPTRARARRCAGSLRARGSLAPLARASRLAAHSIV